MRYTDLIFDLYGTLVDIHTEESELVWEKTALYFGFYGAGYSGRELREGYQRLLSERQAREGRSYECFPDIPMEELLAELFRARGVTEGAESLGFHAAQLFRISSIEYLRCYPHVRRALDALRARGCRLWLLSNAQRAFTAYELRSLGLDDPFDGVYISSDHRCCKPDLRFFRALLSERGLDPARCLMIGNDRQTDIAGARAAGLDTLYLHTALTPADQAPADPALFPGRTEGGRYEFEGDDWRSLLPPLIGLVEGVCFRRGTEGDGEGVLALYKSLLGSPFCVWNGEYPGREEVGHDLETGNLYVLTEGERLVGALSVVPENELDGLSGWTPTGGGHREIARVAVARDCQGRGLARHMVEEIAERLRGEGCPAIRLSAAKKNIPACRTYLGAGFRTVGEAELYGGSYDLMERLLKQEQTQGGMDHEE